MLLQMYFEAKSNTLSIQTELFQILNMCVEYLTYIPPFFFLAYLIPWRVPTIMMMLRLPITLQGKWSKGFTTLGYY